MSKKINNHRGRGRPEKPDKDDYGRVTCVLRADTIEQLQEVAGRHFGTFLQDHLDRYPLPTKLQYLNLIANHPLVTMVKRRKIPTLMATGSLSKEAKRQAKERARRAKLTPEQRAWQDSIRKRVIKALNNANQPREVVPS